MRTKFVSLLAVLFIVAACETTPDEQASTSGAGATTTTSGGTTSGSVTGSAVTPEAQADSQTETTTMAMDGSMMAKEPVPGSQEDLVINVGDRVFFGFDRSVITASAEKTLKRQAAWLRKHATVTLTIEGHADERGTREYNLALGDRRATSVKNFLVALGIDANRIATISYGKERPDALGHTEAAWSQNRRGVSTVN